MYTAKLSVTHHSNKNPIQNPYYLHTTPTNSGNSANETPTLAPITRISSLFTDRPNNARKKPASNPSNPTHRNPKAPRKIVDALSIAQFSWERASPRAQISRVQEKVPPRSLSRRCVRAAISEPRISRENDEFRRDRPPRYRKNRGERGEAHLSAARFQEPRRSRAFPFLGPAVCVAAARPLPRAPARSGRQRPQHPNSAIPRHSLPRGTFKGCGGLSGSRRRPG